MKDKKIIVGISAQNCAGKSDVAEGVLHYIPGIHYSARKVINEVSQKINGTTLSIDTDFTAFSESHKKKYGPQVFLQEILKRFEQSNKRFCIVESLRAPGEIDWLLNDFVQAYPFWVALPIGITASYEDRKHRFLKKRKGEISEQTEDGFDRREKLVNRGVEPWEENVEATLERCIRIFPNPNGKLSDTTNQVESFIRSIAATHGIPL